jgi:hypothetical protein
MLLVDVVQLSLTIRQQASSRPLFRRRGGLNMGDRYDTRIKTGKQSGVSSGDLDTVPSLRGRILS